MSRHWSPLWLKVFSNVVIESTYKEEELYYNRKFKFNSSGIYEHELSEVQPTSSRILRFNISANAAIATINSQFIVT